MKATIQKLYKAINRRLLIQLTFPSLLLLCSFKPGENIGMLKSPVVRKEFKVDNAFKSILLEGNISLVLTNDPAGTVIIEGKKRSLIRSTLCLKITYWLLTQTKKIYLQKSPLTYQP